MPTLTNRVPSYRTHKASGQAIVTLNGVDHYLGPFDTKASKVEYDRLVGEWQQHGRQLPSRSDLTVNELILAYWQFAESYYVKDGKPTSHLDGIRAAFRPLKRLYGDSAAADLGPIALKSVRAELVKSGLCRSYVNSLIGRIKRA